MKIWRSPHEVDNSGDGRAVSIGFFDGLHLGHRALLSDASRRADIRGLQSVVVTFDVHPATILRPSAAPKLLCNIDQKLELLATTGIDATLALTFDKAQSEQPADEFVDDILRKSLGARLIEVGEDFHFGHDRQGNVALLRELGATNGFDVIGHELVGVDGKPSRPEQQISSTAIRRALVDGRLEDANAMLGRPLELRGTVIRGDQRGRQIGFPTANVAVDARMCRPHDGIYAGTMMLNDDDDAVVHQCAIYLGKRPTFYNDAPASLLEVHVLDFDGDLYGTDMRVTFDSFIRHDEKFESVDALAAQLQRDCVSARQYFTVE